MGGRPYAGGGRADGLMALSLCVALAILGAVCIATGVSLWSAPAGFVVAGFELLSAGYMGAYVQLRKAAA